MVVMMVVVVVMVVIVVIVAEGVAVMGEVMVEATAAAAG